VNIRRDLLQFPTATDSNDLLQQRGRFITFITFKNRWALFTPHLDQVGLINFKISIDTDSGRNPAFFFVYS